MAASSPSFSLTASSPLYLLFLRRSSFTNRTRRRYRIKIWFVLKGRGGGRGRVGSKGHLPSSLNELSLPGRKENALRVFFARCPGLFQGRREQKQKRAHVARRSYKQGPTRSHTRISHPAPLRTRRACRGSLPQSACPTDNTKNAPENKKHR